MDTALFFPVRGESTAQAKAVCRACPVCNACLTFSLEAVHHNPLSGGPVSSRGELFGIWGGKSERERQRLRGWKR